MTGTGTQADPYIPTTLTEFITAVGTSGAYVTLTQDINAADDPEYTGELTRGISCIAQSVDGGGFSIRGITVRNSTFALGLTRNGTVQNLNLRDFAHKNEGSTASIARAVTGGGNPTMKNCLISLKNVASAAHIAMEAVNFDNCGLSIEMEDATFGAVNHISNYCQFLHTTMLISGTVKISSSNLSVFAHGRFERSAIILDGTTTSDTGTVHWISPDSGYNFLSSYIAFRDVSGGAVQSVSNTYSQSSIVATDNENLNVILSTGFSRATIEQMKDKDWLTSVGFLP